ncbi:hypothetical protein AB6A40_010644 [Gnathostoma spinigerum]|uniref:BPTI/Kunitz inhibitor domain-containing protein n=1 Tax=Gnathostoma spinigerum TaxID=75299 RepID=A0ABD6EWT5_9BILA
MPDSATAISCRYTHPIKMFSSPHHHVISVLLLISSFNISPISCQENLSNPICNEYADRGTCEDRGFSVKWYYDRFSHRCREFYYSGCGGNPNRFDTFDECDRQCHFAEDQVEGNAAARCHQRHDPGPCGGDYERWFFDPVVQRCVCS